MDPVRLSSKGKSIQCLAFDVLDDARHGFHNQRWVVPHTRFSRQHQGIGAIEHRIGDVARLCARGTAGGDHRLQHLRRDNHRLSCLPAQLDRPLLNERYLLYRKFDTEVSPSDHDSVERLDDLFQILHRLGLFDLRKYRHPNAFVVHDIVNS